MYQTVEQVASQYNRHPMYIRKLAREGILTAIKVNGSWNIEAESAARYFSSSRSHVVRVVEVAAATNFSNDRTFGVEMEVTGISHYDVTRALEAAGLSVSDEYNHYNHETRRSWKVMSDSSISGEGCEVVSPVLRGEAGMSALETACNALVAAGAKINKSCGLHVHIGADDLNVTAVRNLIESYENNSNIINSFLAPSRRSNTYCQDHSYSTRRSFANCRTIEEMAEADTNRYRKVNLQAYPRHGTIEFRQHQGSVEFAKISNWIYFIFALTETAKSESLFSFSNVAEMVSRLGLNESIQNYFVSRANHFAARA